MARFLEIPPERVPQPTLVALLEEYATRDGTDYGEREVSLAAKRASLEHQLRGGELALLFDSDSGSWDLLPRAEARLLLRGAS